MMVPVVRGPPDRSPLGGTGSENRAQKLNDSRSAKSTVREVTVVEACDAKHSDKVKQDTKSDGDGTDPDPIKGNQGQVTEPEWTRSQPVDMPGVLVPGGFKGRIVKSSFEVVGQTAVFGFWIHDRFTFLTGSVRRPTVRHFGNQTVLSRR